MTWCIYERWGGERAARDADPQMGHRGERRTGLGRVRGRDVVTMTLGYVPPAPPSCLERALWFAAVVGAGLAVWVGLGWAVWHWWPW